MRDEIVNCVKEFRVNAGLTQDELARAVGVSRQSIIAIERGRYIPSLPLALHLAEYFGCPTDVLFKRKESLRDG